MFRMDRVDILVVRWSLVYCGTSFIYYVLKTPAIKKICEIVTFFTIHIHVTALINLSQPVINIFHILTQFIHWIIITTWNQSINNNWNKSSVLNERHKAQHFDVYLPNQDTRHSGLIHTVVGHWIIDKELNMQIQKNKISVEGALAISQKVNCDMARDRCTCWLYWLCWALKWQVDCIYTAALSWNSQCERFPLHLTQCARCPWSLN